MPAKTNKIFIYLIAFMAVLCAFWLMLQGQSLRLDESQSLWQISHTTPYVLDLISRDVHVPLYHLLLKAWTALPVSLDVSWGRALSLLFALLSVPLMYSLGKYAAGERVGLYAAGLTGASPFLHWYASEVRMYSLMFFLSALSAYLFIRYFQGDRNSLITGSYILVTVAGVYTHYFFWLILLSQILYALFFKKAGHGSRIFPLAAAVLAMLSFLPWVWLVVERNKVANSTPFLFVPAAVDVFNSFLQFLVGFQAESVQKVLLSFWPLIMLVIFSSLLRRQYNVSVSLGFPTFLIVVVTGLSLAVSVTFRPLYSTRYLTVILPAVYLIISVLVARMRENMQRPFVYAGMAALLVFSSYQSISQANPVREDFKQVTEFLNQKSKAGDVVYLTAPFITYPFEYYSAFPARLETIPAWDRFTQDTIPPFTEENLGKQVELGQNKYARAWVVAAYDQGYEDQVARYFMNNYRLGYEKEFPGKIRLYLFEFRQSGLTANREDAR